MNKLSKKKRNILRRTEKRVRTRARKFGYRLIPVMLTGDEHEHPSYKLVARDGVPFFYDATLTKIDNWLRDPKPEFELHKDMR